MALSTASAKAAQAIRHSASTAASAAQGTADNALTAAGNAASAASAAQTTANAAQTAAGNAQQTADAAAAGLLLKEDKTAMPGDVADIIKQMKTPKTITGNPVTFETVEETYAKGAELTFGPIQDLHGYDSPWPAGAGKNKLNAEVKAATTVTGITGECFADNRFTISGASTGLGDFVTNCTPILVSSGETISITLFGALSFEAGSLFIYIGGKNTNFTAVNQQRTLTFDEDTTIDTVRLGCFNGTTVNGDFKVMIEKGATGSSSYVPYENYCPISGRDGLNLTRTGKNQFDPETLTTARATESGGVYTFSEGTIRTATKLFEVKNPNGQYSLRYKMKTSTNSTNLYIYFIYTDNTNSRDVSAKTANVWNDVVITSDPNKTIEGIYINQYSSTKETAFKDLQIELGSTATAYEEYNGQTYSATFPETVYGGTDEIVGGVGQGEWGYIASYNGETLPSEWISDRDVYAPNTTPTTGAEVAYKLATPTSFSTTPTPILLNAGTNVVSTDADTAAITYTEMTTLDDMRTLINAAVGAALNTEY